MIAILVPVLGRAHQIQPLLQSIAGTTTVDYRVVLIFSPEDNAIHAAIGTDATVLTTTWPAGKADYAKKLALGYQQTTEPWLFQGATDLVFHTNWDTAALTVAKRTNVGVIGTNDLGNPLVKRGQHSTHSLISRDYLERYGGTADNSGLVFSERYDHQWTDSEFVETARRRRQFAFARQSIVEHMHPHWGKGDMDHTYEKAHRETKHDQLLFMRRRALINKLEAKRKHR